MTTTTAIEIAGLTKSYGDHAVLGGVDLSVPAGTVLALLGSNGSGKTTTVKILAAAAESAGVKEEPPISDDLVALLDAAFVEFFPCAPRLFQLLEERGWTGWTDIRRTDAAV